MRAIFKREMRTFFTNPVGYIVLAVLFGFSGWFFYNNNLVGSEYGMGNPDLSHVFMNLFEIVLMAVPFLTMRLFSEERQRKTDQALLTAPVSLTGIVAGKFLATLLLLFIGLSLTFVFAIVVSTQVSVDWMVFFGNFFGLMLVGGLMIAVGLFISTLTESQFVSAIVTLAISIILIFLEQISLPLFDVEWIQSIIKFLSLSSRYSDFTAGLVYFDNVIFFLSFQALFLFLTVRVLDRRRWN
ncbi:MAG: ABC transporter [Ruminococcaceae bacterium]|nr:ABC transporter [Oscillospiraceae bacterium]